MLFKEKVDYRFYLVTDRRVIGDRDLVRLIEEAIQGGVTVVQLREKTASSLEFYRLALQVKAVTERYGVPLIINDRLDIAQAVEAEGLHIGQEDLPAEVVRRIWSEKKILGVSARTVEQALKAQKAGADYLGVGAVFPVYPHYVKDDARLITLEQLKGIKEKVKIPVVAIGGIQAKNAHLVREAGVDGIAVVSGILGQDDVKQASRELSRIFAG